MRVKLMIGRSWPCGRLLEAIPGVFLLAAFFLNFTQPARGQEVTAGMTGTITDPSGAPIPEAKVTATDVLRGTTWPTQSNSAGVYDLPRLPVSTYDVSVEAQGFATAVSKGIVLELNQKARVDVQLSIGSVSQTIEVTGAAPLLTTDTMQLGTIINSRINQELPLATRNYVELTLLAPGVTNPNPSSFTNGQPVGNGGRPFVNGNREQSNNFLLDGVDNNQVSDNLVGYTPSPDAIQEFNMITNNASAEFGNFQGAIISTTIKSGTNELHGTLFEFFRNCHGGDSGFCLNANSWANNWQGSPRGGLHWNMFGGSAGGPIKKDKLFFFGDYQGLRFSTPPNVGFISVITPEERAGDFSRLLSERKIQLYNPFSTDA